MFCVMISLCTCTHCKRACVFGPLIRFPRAIDYFIISDIKLWRNTTESTHSLSVAWQHWLDKQCHGYLAVIGLLSAHTEIQTFLPSTICMRRKKQDNGTRLLILHTDVASAWPTALPNWISRAYSQLLNIKLRWCCPPVNFPNGLLSDFSWAV